MKKWHVGWGPIHNCNIACEFCYSKTARVVDEPLEYNDWISFIDDNHEYISDINYGTGENTLSLEWFRLVEYIRKNYPEIKQALTTNGYLSEQLKKDPSLAQIITNGIDEIDISLDFADEKKYCQFRGSNDVYQWARGTLKFCQENNIPGTIVFIGAKPILYKDNIDGLFAIAKEYDAKIRMNIYRPTNPDPAINEKFIASYQQLLDALYHINDKYKILALSDPLFNAILTIGRVEDDPSGQNSVRILHNGMVTPSTYLISKNFQRYNIKEKKVFKKIHTEGAFESLTSMPETCQGCQFQASCKGGVYDRRYLWHKDFSQRDPYCPFNEGNFLPDNLVTIHDGIPFESIHYGYLPSLFFTN